MQIRDYVRCTVIRSKRCSIMLPARQVFEEARKGFCACMMYMKTRSSDVRKDIKGKHTTVLVFSDENVNDV